MYLFERLGAEYTRLEERCERGRMAVQGGDMQVRALSGAGT